MFRCDSRFERYTKVIHRVWENRFLTIVGNWNRLEWWAVVMGLLMPSSLCALMAASAGSLSFFEYTYCPIVKDCFALGPSPRLPLWAWMYISLSVGAFVFGLMAQWGYRHKQWCLAWWAYAGYFYAAYFVVIEMMAESFILLGVGRSPVAIVLVGYGILLVYSLWFIGAFVTIMRPIFKWERTTFPPPPLKLEISAGSTVAVLGLLGVALGRLLGETPQGHWGALALGLIFLPWFMGTLIREGVATLHTLAPWRIVMEFEAATQAAKAALYDSTEAGGERS